MLRKARYLLVIATTTIFLFACSSELLEETSSEDTAKEITEVVANAESTGVSESITTHSTTESEEDVEATDENTEIEEEAESEEAVSSEHEEASEDFAESTYQDAVNQFIATTGLDIQTYRFAFEETDEFVEISVYEKTEEDQKHTPLVGRYRYMLETAEILIQDYLTGAFVLYEETE